jgi:hypothetical protein
MGGHCNQVVVVVVMRRCFVPCRACVRCAFYVAVLSCVSCLLQCPLHWAVCYAVLCCPVWCGVAWCGVVWRGVVNCFFFVLLLPHLPCSPSCRHYGPHQQSPALHASSSGAGNHQPLPPAPPPAAAAPLEVVVVVAVAVAVAVVVVAVAAAAAVVVLGAGTVAAVVVRGAGAAPQRLPRARTRRGWRTVSGRFRRRKCPPSLSLPSHRPGSGPVSAPGTWMRARAGCVAAAPCARIVPVCHAPFACLCARVCEDGRLWFASMEGVHVLILCRCWLVSCAAFPPTPTHAHPRPHTPIYSPSHTHHPPIHVHTHAHTHPHTPTHAQSHSHAHTLIDALGTHARRAAATVCARGRSAGLGHLRDNWGPVGAGWSVFASPRAPHISHRRQRRGKGGDAAPRPPPRLAAHPRVRRRQRRQRRCRARRRGPVARLAVRPRVQQRGGRGGAAPARPRAAAAGAPGSGAGLGG